MALRQALDTKLKNEDDITGVTALPVLGRIPFDAKAKHRPLVVTADPQSVQSEAYRQLRTNLQFVSSTGRSRIVLVTSSVPGEGKSASAVNLALSLAEAGSRVCLVEADLRRPGIGRYLDLEGAVGLTTVLIGAVDVQDAVQPWGGLHVLMSGERPPNPSEMLGSPAMGELLDTLQDRYDIVIVDGAPLLPVTDSAVLSRLCSGVVVVVGAGHVRRRELSRSIADLEAVGANLAGLLLTKLPTKGPDGNGMKTYTYQTAPASRRDEANGKRRKERRRDRSAGTGGQAVTAESRVESGVVESKIDAGDTAEGQPASTDLAHRDLPALQPK
jgi:capsular exopolysaccharide synthesis family protein